MEEVTKSVFGIMPKDKYQQKALVYLRDPNVHLVGLGGLAGSGKSLLAICAGLEGVQKGIYERILIWKPVAVPLEEMGFLPGKIEDKVKPYMSSIYDLVSFLRQVNKFDKRNLAFLDRVGNEEEGIFVVESIFGIKGRTLKNTFILGDEVEDYTSMQIRAICTRAGDGTKIVMTGDVDQSGLVLTGGEKDGLSFVNERMRGHHLYRYILLPCCYRSPLAKACGERMKPRR